jgi:hypothetical protein
MQILFLALLVKYNPYFPWCSDISPPIFSPNKPGILRLA